MRERLYQRPQNQPVVVATDNEESPARATTKGQEENSNNIYDQDIEELPLSSSDNGILITLLRVFTNGVMDNRIHSAADVVRNSELTVHEKLTKIDSLIRIPASASAERLGELLGKSKQAVLKSGWWAQNRKGEKASEIGRRRIRHMEMKSDIQSEDDGNTQ